MTPLDDDSFYDEDGSLTSQNAMTPKFRSWATLKPGTPFTSIFPDGQVPLTPNWPFLDASDMSTYLDVDLEQLAPSQLSVLAELLLQKGLLKDESTDEAIASIQRRGCWIECACLDEWEIESPEVDNPQKKSKHKP